MLDLKLIDAAVSQIALEKKIPKEKLYGVVEAALKSAYKRDFGSKDMNVNVVLDFEKNSFEMSVEKTVVAADDLMDEDLEITLEELGGEESGYTIGDVVEIDVTDDVLSNDGFGRIASQVARQVIVSKIQETEKEKIYDLFKDKVGEVLSLKVEMIENKKVVLDFNGNQVILPKSEQTSLDKPTPGSRMHVYVKSVNNDLVEGPRVTLTRKDKDFVVKLFEMHVPELEDGTIEIVAIARIPGVKTKVIVGTEFDEVDPAGCMIGPKGIRVRAVVDEISGEKLDIINYTPDMAELAKESLVPGDVIRCEVDEENRSIIAYVSEEEKPKVLGKGGVNVNLASELLGYSISVRSVDAAE
ncbi:MAG: transcription termination factor NusA [Candidatus Gracilibacteria bacterium]